MVEKEKKEILVLLDAHAILHRAYHALPDFSSSKGEPTGALYGLSTMLLKIIRELNPDYIVACYDLPKPTFRHEAYKDYKQGRAKAQDDLVHQIKRSREVFNAFNIPIYDKEGFEADDILGTIVDKVKKDKHIKVVVASGDMDTLQLVRGDDVVVYTLKKGIKDTVIYNEKGVVERFGFSPELLPDFKGLRGDPSDNIVGISGIGEKTASLLIERFGTIEDMYKKLKEDEGAFEAAGVKQRIIQLLKDGEEEALFSKTLATIRRDAPIVFKLPEKKWRLSFDTEKAKTFFAEVEFRTLRDRIANEFEEGADEKHAVENESIDEEELKKMKIAVWLLNSDITNPVLNDVLDIAHTTSFAKAKEYILGEIKKQKLERVYYEIELPLLPIIERAEKRGILVHIEHLQSLSKEYHKELSLLEKDIWKIAGREFNINSPKQLGEILFDELELSAKGLKKTPGGARSTRESELLKLKGQHEIIEKILAHREIQKLLSTYIDNIPHMVEKDGRLHTNLNQTGTTTGRMSSNNPNLQNIPAKEGVGDAIRRAFVAEKGHVFLAFDYSQIEMRVLALLARDEKLLDIFEKGKDVHAGVAAHVFGVSEGEVTKDMRRKAKVINFGIVYGMGVNALKENLGSTRIEAQEFYNNYFERFPRIADYFDAVKKSARQKGYTETLFGRKRHFEGIRSSVPFIRAAAERMAMNAPIQGTAADIMKMAMKNVDEVLEKKKLKEKAHLILTVHDELIYEVEKSVAHEVSALVKEAMENVLKEKIPFLVNVSKGDTWGTLKSV